MALTVKKQFSDKLDKLKDNINTLIDQYENNLESTSLRDKIIDINNAIDIYNDNLLKTSKNSVEYGTAEILEKLIPVLYGLR